MFSIKEAVKYGWQKIKEHFWKLVGASACLMAIGLVSNVFSGAMEKNTSSGVGVALFIGIVAAIILSVMIRIGYTKFTLSMYDGQVLPIKSVFNAYGVFWRYIWVCILQGLIMIGGFILLIVPGIIWAIKYSFAPTIVIDTGVSASQALKESANITDGSKWKLLGFYIVLGLLNLLGYIVIGIGILVRLPLTSLAYVYVYRTLYQKKAAVAAPAPSPAPATPVQM